MSGDKSRKNGKLGGRPPIVETLEEIEAKIARLKTIRDTAASQISRLKKSRKKRLTIT